MNEPKLITALGDPKDNRTRWVLVSDNGREVLLDGASSNQVPWSTYSKQEAKLQKKICEKDFKQKVHIRTLEEAIQIISKRRYGIEIKPPLTWHNVKNQLIDLIITGKIKE